MRLANFDDLLSPLPWAFLHNQDHPYERTAARKHGKPGRELRPPSITIDIHAHVSVPSVAALVAPHLEISSAPLAFFSNPETNKVNQQQEIDRHTRLSGLENGLAERLRDLDDMGIDRQIVMPPPPQCYYTVPLEIGVKAARAVNDGIAAFVARAPDRFIGLGTVPMQDGHEAAAEIERTMSQLGFKGAEVLTNVGGRELSDQGLHRSGQRPNSLERWSSSIQTGLPTPSGFHASISTTWSEIRWRRLLHCITSSSTACSSAIRI